MDNIVSIIRGSIIGTFIGIGVGNVVWNIYSPSFTYPTFYERVMQEECSLSDEQTIEKENFHDNEESCEEADKEGVHENCTNPLKDSKDTNLDNWIISDENLATTAEKFTGMKDLDLSDCPPLTNWVISDENLATAAEKFAGMKDLDLSDIGSLDIP